MKEIEILSTLEELDWKCDRNEAGDYFYLMDIGEVRIQVIPTIGKRSDYLRVSSIPSVSTKNFMAVVIFVLGGTSNYMPIIMSNYVSEKVVDSSLGDVVRFSRSVISWASAQDIEKGLAAYRALPINSKGAMPLRHLAALTIAGGVSCLTNYQLNFEQGDRLGFVPYITQDIIERALLVTRSVR